MEEDFRINSKIQQKPTNVTNMGINYQQKPIVIQFENLTKIFGDFTAVNQVNLEIHEGEVVGFLGPNGAGKSTTMKMMAFLLKPTSGTIYIRQNGELQKLTNNSKDYLLDEIGFLIENPAFYENISPREILSYFADLKGYPRTHIPKRVEEVVGMMKMMDWIDKPIGTFSKGMRQKIGILSAIVHDPQIIVLDEPHTGLDPKARKEVRNFILRLKKMGKTIFLSSHLLYEVSEVADRVAIISNGQLIACDTLDNLEARAKKSLIQLELWPHPNGEAQRITQKLNALIFPIAGVSEASEVVQYNNESEQFEIVFDGSPETQAEIFRVIATSGLNPIEFSVPKAGLLESLYLEMVN